MQQSSAKVESTEDTITGYVPIPGIGCELGEKRMSSLLVGGHQADVSTWKVCVSWGGEGKHPQQPWEKQVHNKAPPRLSDRDRGEGGGGALQGAQRGFQGLPSGLTLGMWMSEATRGTVEALGTEEG